MEVFPLPEGAEIRVSPLSGSLNLCDPFQQVKFSISRSIEQKTRLKRNNHFFFNLLKEGPDDKWLQKIKTIKRRSW